MGGKKRSYKIKTTKERVSVVDQKFWGISAKESGWYKTDRETKRKKSYLYLKKTTELRILFLVEAQKNSKLKLNEHKNKEWERNY